MVNIGPKDKRTRNVLLASFATSVLLLSLFLSWAVLDNRVRGYTAYTGVDIAAGSIFVFVITMIISMSLWPKLVDKLEERKENGR